MSSTSYNQLEMDSYQEFKSQRKCRSSCLWLALSGGVILLLLLLVSCVALNGICYQASLKRAEELMLKQNSLEHSLHQVELQLQREITLSDKITRMAIAELKLNESLITNIMEEIQVSLAASTTEMADVSDQVQIVFQNTSANTQLIEVMQVAVADIVKQFKEMQVTVADCEDKVKKLESEQGDLVSQLHHPVTAYSNCQIITHNLACEVNSTSPYCPAQQVSLEMKGFYILDHYCQVRTPDYETKKIDLQPDESGQFLCKCFLENDERTTDLPSASNPCVAIVIHCPLS